MMHSERELPAGARIALAVALSIALAAAVLALFTKDFSPALGQFFFEPFANRYFFGNYIADSVPLMIAGLGVLIAFRSRNFNLGGEGQIYAGAIAAGMLALSLPERISPPQAWLFAALAGMVAGGLIGALSGILKALWHVSEMISSFLISAIVLNVGDYLITGPFQDPASNFQTTRQISSQLLLPKILAPSKLDISVFIGLALIAVLAIMSKHTRPGFELRVCGENEEFARYCGIPVALYQSAAMAISGALYGLAGALIVMGPQARVMRGFSSGLGWSAISVALLAQSSEAGILPSALFIAYLKAGSDHVMIGSGVPSEIISILQAAAMFFITARHFPLRKRRRP
ncbi:MAG: ABC transporter permease [Spirochaetota bacterium]|jgi:simple sugar transport system permease protein